MAIIEYFKPFGRGAVGNFLKKITQLRNKHRESKYDKYLKDLEK